jgi:diguanylate cyclase (GGDEF)-like protein
MNAQSLSPTIFAGGSDSRPPRLLVVDDQPVNIQALYQAFAADHQVLMATNGPQALALCASQQPDLVLLDVVMPAMDGHEVCRRLKADPATRDIPVIFVTAHDDEAAETQGLEAGAVDFISKPINPKIVRARVKTHLTLKAQADLLRQWVYLDGLTGVHNRRCFDERLATEWARAQRSGSALSVVLLDVDFFKRYNDLYGHQAGDDCLRRVAACLRQGLKRPGDLLARYGGEEFVCLLPETPLQGALDFARQLGQSVAALGIEHADSPAAACVTVSLGVCTQAASASGTAQALLREADAQLYIAKSGGRNQARGAELPEG